MNWSKYNKNLQQRGPVFFWIDAKISEWWYSKKKLEEVILKFILKTIFGPILQSKKFENQKMEISIKIGILNKMTSLGYPNTT